MAKNVEQTDFGAKLKAAREAAGLTQQQLADRAGMYVHNIAKMERGVREPTWPTALKLAKALGVSVAAFEGRILAEAPPGPSPTGETARGGGRATGAPSPGGASKKASGRRAKGM
jgi:transcriptional regulator with XRE-family HTH domain